MQDNSIQPCSHEELWKSVHLRLTVKWIETQSQVIGFKDILSEFISESTKITMETTLGYGTPAPKSLKNEAVLPSFPE